MNELCLTNIDQIVNITNVMRRDFVNQKGNIRNRGKENSKKSA